MIITQEEKNRIKSLSSEQLLTEWGKIKYDERFIAGISTDKQPFNTIVYKDKDGKYCEEHHNYLNLSDEYIIWLTEHKSEDGKILTDEQISDSMIGKTMGEINEKATSERRDSGEFLNKQFSPNREKMLTVQKLIDYLKTQNPNACIMAYEPNSFGYIEQWPTLPNTAIRTVKEDMDSQRDFLLNQWLKDSVDKEKRCEDELSETYRYCKDDDIIIRF